MKFFFLIFTLLTIKMYAQAVCQTSNYETLVKNNIEKLKNKGICNNCCLRGADLQGLCISSAKNSDLTGTKLSKSTFKEKVNLEGAILDDIDSSKNTNSKSNRQSFFNANLKNVSMQNCNMPNINIVNDTFTNNVDGADFTGSSFAVANIQNVDFSTVKSMQNTNFLSCTLNSIQLPDDKTKLEGINLNRASNGTTASPSIFVDLKNCLPQNLNDIFAYGSITPCAQKLCSLGIDITNLTVNNFTFQDGCDIYK